MVDALKRDPQLVQPDGKHQGSLAFLWSYGVVLPNINRKQFEEAELQHAIEPHRVIHGVAGSGKTMILGYRAEYLAKICQSTSSKPILILCFNEPLGVKLHSVMKANPRRLGAGLGVMFLVLWGVGHRYAGAVYQLYRAPAPQPLLERLLS